MTPSWSNAQHRLPSEAIWSWGRCWWLGEINPRFLAFKILKIDPLFIACHNPMQKRLSFWQAEFGMCFGVAYRSVHAVPIFRSFEPFPWPHRNDCLRNTQLLGKHFLRLDIVLVQKSLQLTILNLPELIFTLLVLRSKLSSLNRRNQSLHVVSDKALSP